MTDLHIIRDIDVSSKASAAQLQRPVDPLLIRTIRQLNAIGIYDGATMTAVYGRRLARVEAGGQASAGSGLGEGGMSTPQRIQLSRKAGWRMPVNTVKVDRTTKWGNPWRVQMVRIISVDGDREGWVVDDLKPQKYFDDEAAAISASLTKFRKRWDHPAMQTARGNLVAELRGKNLACWCKPGAPCHADVLLELANREAS